MMDGSGKSSGNCEVCPEPRKAALDPIGTAAAKTLDLTSAGLQRADFVLNTSNDCHHGFFSVVFRVIHTVLIESARFVHQHPRFRRE